VTGSGVAAPFAPRADRPGPGSHESADLDELGNALVRLGRALDDLLLADGCPGRHQLRTARLVTTHALLVLQALAEEIESRRWRGPLEADLRGMAAEYARATGALTHVRAQGSSAALPDEVSGALRRVVLEALLNVGRHSRAGVVLLWLRVDEASVSLDVVDDGVDLPTRQSGAWRSSVDLGLRNMRRSMEAVGGGLTVHPLRPRGVRFHAAVPATPRSLG
jgi:signal transduction histidine kinase